MAQLKKQMPLQKCEQSLNEKTAAYDNWSHSQCHSLEICHLILQ